MDDPLAVGVGHRVGRGDHVRQQGQPLLELGRRGDRVGEGAPFAEQPHRVERSAVLAVAGVVDRHDARVLEPGGEQRLAVEAGPRPFGQRLLDRHRPGQPAVPGEMHPAQLAARQLRAQLVARRRLPAVGSGLPSSQASTQPGWFSRSIRVGASLATSPDECSSVASVLGGSNGTCRPCGSSQVAAMLHQRLTARRRRCPIRSRR